mmetsp:Transcript_55690/g.169457  ORF Transcript_55690/g.169457 Transcript_55690/m.169457 type:complete len:258 (+) Transcript_55690:166-939(+)
MVHLTVLAQVDFDASSFADVLNASALLADDSAAGLPAQLHGDGEGRGLAIPLLDVSLAQLRKQQPLRGLASLVAADDHDFPWLAGRHLALAGHPHLAARHLARLLDPLAALAEDGTRHVVGHGQVQAQLVHAPGPAAAARARPRGVGPGERQGARGRRRLNAHSCAAGATTAASNSRGSPCESLMRAVGPDHHRQYPGQVLLRSLQADGPFLREGLRVSHDIAADLGLDAEVTRLLQVLATLADRAPGPLGGNAQLR